MCVKVRSSKLISISLIDAALFVCFHCRQYSIKNTCQQYRSALSICTRSGVAVCLQNKYRQKLLHRLLDIYQSSSFRERQQEINRAATRADGASFQRDVARRTR